MIGSVLHIKVAPSVSAEYGTVWCVVAITLLEFLRLRGRGWWLILQYYTLPVEHLQYNSTMTSALLLLSEV
jgi:hypothetical protein